MSHPQLPSSPQSQHILTTQLHSTPSSLREGRISSAHKISGTHEQTHKYAENKHRARPSILLPSFFLWNGLCKAKFKTHVSVTRTLKDSATGQWNSTWLCRCSGPGSTSSITEKNSYNLLLPQHKWECYQLQVPMYSVHSYSLTMSICPSTYWHTLPQRHTLTTEQSLTTCSMMLQYRECQCVSYSKRRLSVNYESVVQKRRQFWEAVHSRSRSYKFSLLFFCFCFFVFVLVLVWMFVCLFLVLFYFVLRQCLTL